MWTGERLTERFDRIDERFDQIDRRFDRVDQRFDRLEGRFESLERRMDDGFRELRAEMTAMRRDLHMTMLSMLGATMAALVAIVIKGF